MALEPILRTVRENGALDEWVGKRTGRQASVLCASLGVDGNGSVRAMKDVLRSARDDDLMPYLLVEQFSKYKSKIATVEFAIGVLSEDTLETCRVKDDEFDKTALLFAIFRRQPTDLRLVFHLDKIHKSGFARMKLRETARRRQQSFQDFLQPETLKRSLAEFDAAKRDRRTSEFKGVVTHDGSQLVFIRRAERPDLILRADGVVHGHRPDGRGRPLRARRAESHRRRGGEPCGDPDSAGPGWDRRRLECAPDRVLGRRPVPAIRGGRPVRCVQGATPGGHARGSVLSGPRFPLRRYDLLRSGPAHPRRPRRRHPIRDGIRSAQREQ